MSNLRKNEDYVLTLLEGLKFLRDENKSLSKKLDQKFAGQSSVSEEYLKGKLRQILGEIDAKKNVRKNESSK